jgi:hypothetical protein
MDIDHNGAQFDGWTLLSVKVRGKTQKTDVSYLELMTPDTSIKGVEQMASGQMQA